MTNTADPLSISTSPSTHRTHRIPALLLAAALAVAGVLGSVVIAVLADTAVTTALEGATRGPSSGFSVTTHPDPYFVYSVDGAPVSAVTVTAPDGSTLPVTLGDHAFGYGPHKQGLQVGSFDVPVGTGLVDHRVAATPAAETGDVTLAVTTFDVAATNRLRTVGVVVLLVVNLGSAGLVLVYGARSGRRPTVTRS